MRNFLPYELQYRPLVQALDPIIKFAASIITIDPSIELGAFQHSSNSSIQM